MAEVSESRNVLDLLVSRQRSENTQGVRQQDDDDDRRNGRRSAQSLREEQSQETRGAAQGEQVQRFNATQQLAQTDNQNVFERVIDQNGNEVSGAGEQAQSGVQADQQRLADDTSQRQQRVEERADRTEQRLQEQVSQDRSELASSDSSLPRGSIIDISA
jgi:hypothetical protein